MRFCRILTSLFLSIVVDCVVSAGSAHTTPDGVWSPDVALRGVHPTKLGLYTATKSTQSFQCLDRSKRIPFSAVNDDYCDCQDGSDEPGTSACSNGTFHCKNKGHIGADILSSRVNDGVCDPECCDGSDEYLGLINCPDKCKEVGTAYKKHIEEQRRILAEGERLAREYAAYGAKQQTDRTTQIAKLETQISVLDGRIKKLAEIKAAAEAYEEKRKAKGQTVESAEQEEESTRLKGKCCPTLEKCREMLDEQIGHNLLLDERIEYLQEGAWNLDSVEEATREDDHAVSNAVDGWEGYKLMYYFFDEETVDEELDTADEQPANEMPITGNDDEQQPKPKPKPDCCTRLKKCKREVDDEQEKHLHLQDRLEALLKVFYHLNDVKVKSKRDDEAVGRAYEKFNDYRLMFRGEKIPPMPDIEELDVRKEASEVPRTTEVPRTKNATEDCNRPDAPLVSCLRQRLQSYSKSLWKQMLALVRTPTAAEEAAMLRVDPIKAKAKFNLAETQRFDLQEKLNHLKKLKDVDFGPAGVWEKLFEQCFEYDAAEYKYYICLLQKAEQKPKSGTAGTNLGTFTRWGRRDDKLTTAANRYKYMMYENGDQCWNGPARSVEVALECGADTKVLSVVEMSKCEYTARLRSPAACDLAIPEQEIEKEAASAAATQSTSSSNRDEL
ncbi:uncharacterized protein SPPG_06603 [Spizellomyces punctatus DAOM BR117]|uniref:Glucosidase 2 subunit beta n=1 Tax=Spizellomyces punctatus (strain DAOM BR117) TaxID=645134 RepID=A0A0L0HB95_SPIPD|nr:uncharacterized protein SPPG_06603 [Spizellomyces punctatus DAOM BR117]KNC98201.1 hypothetical protein SPPG_06603 [Spizellomyces punctatus DAOM BR117]|eukprot:XP_016606241.1 hypothetical protein SPPG_06603 [Spizellomyces punctatus DAOM BR117]